MGAEEVAALWERMRSGGGAQPRTAAQAAAPALPAAAAATPVPPRDTAASAECFASLDALVACVEGGRAALLDAAPARRRAELERLRALAAPPELLQDAAAEPLGKCLLPRFEDASERCRQLAAETVLLLVQRAPVSVLSLLPYAVPVLHERLVRAPAAAADPEPSEEVRLATVQLAAALLDAADAACLPYGGELVELLEAALRDDAPAVACAACAATVRLCAVAGRRLGDAATRLAVAATPLLTHRRAAARLAALDAVGAAVHAGAHAHLMTLAAFQHGNEVPLSAFYGGEAARVNYLGKLATDGHAGVRAAFLATLAGWLLRLAERADHAPLLLPYVLSAVADGAPEVAAAAREALEALGAAHEAQHAAALADAARYRLRDAGDEEPGAPRLGTRLLVRDALGHCLPGAVADLRAWTAHVRPRAAALLETLLAYARDGAGRYAHDLVPALCAAAADEDAEVARRVMRCAQLLARFTPPALWLPLALQQVEQRCAAAPQLLEAMLAAGDAAALAPHAEAIAAALRADDATHAELRRALARLQTAGS